MSANLEFIINQGSPEDISFQVRRLDPLAPSTNATVITPNNTYIIINRVSKTV